MPNTSWLCCLQTLLCGPYLLQAGYTIEMDGSERFRQQCLCDLGTESSKMEAQGGLTMKSDSLLLKPDEKAKEIRLNELEQENWHLQKEVEGLTDALKSKTLVCSVLEKKLIRLLEAGSIPGDYRRLIVIKP